MGCGLAVVACHHPVVLVVGCRRVFGVGRNNVVGVLMEKATIAYEARILNYIGPARLRFGHPPLTVHDEPPVVAYINHGRWVADCPCGGAELVAEDRLMVCGSCAARSEVIFPPNVTVLESALAARLKKNKNWKPTETVADLLAENKERM
jgi:hypothetical protein